MQKSLAVLCWSGLCCLPWALRSNVVDVEKAFETTLVTGPSGSEDHLDDHTKPLVDPVEGYTATDHINRPLCGEIGFVIVTCGYTFANGVWDWAGNTNGKPTYVHSTAKDDYNKELVIRWRLDPDQWELSVDGTCMYVSSVPGDCPSEGWTPLGVAPPPGPIVESVYARRVDLIETSKPARHHKDDSKGYQWLYRWFWENMALGKAGLGMYFDMYLCANPPATEREITLQHMSARTAHETAAAIHLSNLLEHRHLSLLPPVPGVRVVYPNEIAFSSLMMELWPSHKKNVFVAGAGFGSESIHEDTRIYATPADDITIGNRDTPLFMTYIDEFGASVFDLAVPEFIFSQLTRRADQMGLHRTDPLVERLERKSGGKIKKITHREVGIWIDPLVVINFRPSEEAEAIRLKGGTIFTPEPGKAAGLLQRMIGADYGATLEFHPLNNGAVYSVTWLENGEDNELTFMGNLHKMARRHDNNKVRLQERSKPLNPALGSSNHFALQLPHRSAQWLREFFENEGVQNWQEGSADNPDKIVFNFFFVELAENCFFDVIPNVFKPFAGNRLEPDERLVTVHRQRKTMR